MSAMVLLAFAVLNEERDEGGRLYRFVANDWGAGS